MAELKNSLHNDYLRPKVHSLYSFIRDHLYFNRPDMEIKGKRFNTTLLMSFLVALSQGKALIIGEPGLGKTTSAENVSALLYRIPLGTLWKSEIAGHPEQTEEKIIGRPDLGALNQGKEVVIWSHFTLLPVKIVDEINRLPETKQSMILDGVDRGNWEYLNDAVINPEFCLFATANYQDRGTNTIIAPLMDRFDVMVESKHPGANMAAMVGIQGGNGHLLHDPDLEADFHQVLSARLPVEERMQELECLSDRFGQKLVTRIGLEGLSHPERRQIRTLKSELPFDTDVRALLRLVLAELSFCYRYGQKRSQEHCEEACHFTGYLCQQIRNCISNRFAISICNLSQTLAWLLGDRQVDIEHFIAVMPFTLAHRLQWRDHLVAQAEKEPRNDPLEIFMARQAVHAIHQRYTEQAPRIKEAMAVAYRIMEGEELVPLEGDHPIYWEIRKDLGEMVNST